MKKTPFLLYGFPHLHHTTNLKERKPYIKEKKRYQNHINIAIQHVFPLFSQIQNINFIIVKIVKKVDFQKVKG